MNPGFPSFIFICISLILLASGWKLTLLGGISDRAIAAVFGLWLAVGLLRIGHADAAVIDGAVAALLAVTVIGALGGRFPLHAVHLFSIGLFLGSVYYLFTRLGELNPFFWPHGSWAPAGLLVAVAAAMLVRNLRDQIAVLSLALLFGTVLYMRLHKQRTGISLGGLRFQDQWWLALFTARLLSLAGETTIVMARGASRTIMGKWKGTKK